ncbi:MAG: DUF456 domain-containing protein [Bacteroidetes bacterium]|nr:DUF456 domain-containing protein [Bacteroidota bacterium]
MEVILFIIAILLALTGLAGCIIPGLPGPPLNFMAILLVQWAFQPFSASFLWIWAAITLVVVILDYFLPVWVSKKFGATREGIIGSIIGLIAGMIFPPIGMIAGLIIGAVLGDMIAGKSLQDAAKSGLGNAVGTLFSIGFKLIVSGMLTWYTFSRIVMYYL